MIGTNNYNIINGSEVKEKIKQIANRYMIIHILGKELRDGE